VSVARHQTLAEQSAHGGLYRFEVERRARSRKKRTTSRASEQRRRRSASLCTNPHTSNNGIKGALSTFTYCTASTIAYRKLSVVVILDSMLPRDYPAFTLRCSLTCKHSGGTFKSYYNHPAHQDISSITSAKERRTAVWAKSACTSSLYGLAHG
jgi:hypothetical protein